MTMALSVVFFLLLVSSSTAFASSCPPSDLAALLDFKASMEESKMGFFRTWTGTNCCKGWYGISCDQNNGRVADIELRGETEHPPVYLHSSRIAPTPGFMSGKIPVSICNLDRLTTLVLAEWKNISGTIPDCIVNLPILRILDLVGNKITGKLPEKIGKLQRLTVLNVGDNLIHGSIPSSLPNLKSLMHLDLSDNKLTGTIPSNFGNLK